MANSNKRQALKLRKGHAVSSIIMFVIVVTLVSALLVFEEEIFLSYTVNMKANFEIRNTVLLSNMLANDHDDTTKLLVADDYEYLLCDEDLNVIESHGENTCLLEETAVTIADDDEFIPTGTKILPDQKGNFIIPILMGRSDMKLTDVLNNLSQQELDEIFIEEQESFVIPFWVSVPMEDGNYFLLRSYLISRSQDVTMFVFLFLAQAGLILVFAVVMLINIISNISNRRKLTKMLFMDNVSNGHNWMWFLIKGEELLKKRRNCRNKYAVINLVFVKYRNFVLCHSLNEGEAVLRDVYGIIRGSVSKKDMVAHSTSSNFPMLVRYTDEKELRMNIQTMISKLEKISSDHKFSFQAGVALIDPGSRAERSLIDLDHIYNNACAARASLEATDESGIAFFDRQLLEDHKWIDRVEERQQAALENEEFKVYYQPKYDPRTDELTGAEALVRWQSDEMGFVAPYKFIPIFETSGFIKELDHYMIAHVAADQKRWLDMGFNCVPVSVNVSRAHFVEDDLADQIRKIVMDAGCPADLIEIELTESAFFDDKKAMVDTIRKLQKYGFTVSMDDFGSGYSSLNSLKDLPLNVLKLDAEFFRGSNDNGRADKVVSEAIKLARALNMRTVAEGVEEKKQVDFLAAEGCDMIQGYYYAKPMPGDEYEKRMTGAAGSTETQAEEEDTPEDGSAEK